MEKRRLGRGLDSLIPELGDQAGDAAAPQEVPLRSIELNPKQPRTEVDPDELQRLADSITASGVIQPIVVRPARSIPGMYELVVGERRVRAAKLAGLESIPAVVRDVPDDRMLELALVENIQRADLNAIEKAKAVRRMIDELGLTQEEAGRRLGLERSTVTNMLRLLELSGDLQEMVSRGTLSAGHARALLGVEHQSVRTRLARKIAADGLSVREAERLVVREGDAARTPRVRQATPNVVDLEEALAAALGARVEIKAARRKGGKIVVHYADNADFERVYEKMTGRSTVDYPRRVPA